MMHLNTFQSMIKKSNFSELMVLTSKNLTLYKSDSLFNMNHNQDSILSLDMEPKPFASK